MRNVKTIAMQKVVGSSPISRSEKVLQIAGFPEVTRVGHLLDQLPALRIAEHTLDGRDNLVHRTAR
jgi:hypothetical protein